MEYNLGDSPVTSHSWNANRTRKFNITLNCNLVKQKNIHYMLILIYLSN